MVVVASGKITVGFLLIRW